MSEAIDFIKNYNGSNNFFNSLKDFYSKNGKLTDGQAKAVCRSISPKNSFKIGQQIEIKKWLANSLAKENDLNFFFRNLKIEAVYRETEKAINVDVSFFSEIAVNCHCCGRALTDEISQAVGVGPICIKKYLGINKPNIKDVEVIRAAITAKANDVGIVKSLWIPKSQIKEVDNAN